MVREVVETFDGSEPRDEALPRLVSAHGGRLYALGLRFCGDRQEAEDLVQETFLQAYRHWDQFEGRAKVATWLYTIAARVCQRLHRKKAGEPDHIESLEELLPFSEPCIGVVPDSNEPLASEIRREGRERIEAAIANLELEFRMPLVLKEVMGLSLKEIGSIMDLKEATVKTRLHRARLRIRRALEGALPKREVQLPAYSTQVCLDLLQAKMDALDRSVAFEFPAEVVCERCAELFATMDLAGDLCAEIARGELPPGLRAQLLGRLKRES